MKGERKYFMSELTDELALYGVDVKGTMDRFDDDEELYKSCLKVFLEDENFNHLKDLSLKKQYSDAFTYAHALKGMVINLGITPLADILDKTEEYVKQENDKELNNLIPKLFHKIQQLKCIMNK